MEIAKEKNQNSHSNSKLITPEIKAIAAHINKVFFHIFENLINYTKNSDNHDLLDFHIRSIMDKKIINDYKYYIECFIDPLVKENVLWQKKRKYSKYYTNTNLKSVLEKNFSIEFHVKNNYFIITGDQLLKTYHYCQCHIEKRKTKAIAVFVNSSLSDVTKFVLTIEECDIPANSFNHENVPPPSSTKGSSPVPGANTHSPNYYSIKTQLNARPLSISNRQKPFHPQNRFAEIIDLSEDNQTANFNNHNLPPPFVPPFQFNSYPHELNAVSIADFNSHVHFENPFTPLENRLDSSFITSEQQTSTKHSLQDADAPTSKRAKSFEDIVKLMQLQDIFQDIDEAPDTTSGYFIEC